jgi:ketol-acid reductoisomerase
MAKIYYEKDAKMTNLKGKTIGIIGYGIQGHAQAQNLRDSDCSVIVAEVKNTPGWKAAKEDKFKVMAADEVAKEADILVMLAPDMLQARIYREQIAAGLTAGKMLMFAHGFNIHYGQIVPPKNIDITMIAPKCPGKMLRQLYVENAGPPALIAVEQDATGKAKDIALAYARGIGCARAGVLETSFAEETETDLFGEQVVLCGGVSALIKAGFETLVMSGYQPEVAYFECLHELKLIVDLIYEGGLTHMRNSVSETARYGDFTRGPRVVDEVTKAEMEDILEEIQDGRFAREWILENQAGRPVFNALQKMDEEHLIEDVGKELRGMMSWLQKK